MAKKYVVTRRQKGRDPWFWSGTLWTHARYSALGYDDEDTARAAALAWMYDPIKGVTFGFEEKR
jgi:hypothetical protein